MKQNCEKKRKKWLLSKYIWKFVSDYFSVEIEIIAFSAVVSLFSMSSHIHDTTRVS